MWGQEGEEVEERDWEEGGEVGRLSIFGCLNSLKVKGLSLLSRAD
jgi:hypothetical protein